MAVREIYSLLRDAVRISASPRYSPHVRIHRLLRHLVRKGGFASAAVFAPAPEDGSLAFVISDSIRSAPLLAGDVAGLASLCVARRRTVAGSPADLAPFEAPHVKGDAVVAFPVPDSGEMRCVLLLGCAEGGCGAEMRRFIGDVVPLIAALLAEGLDGGGRKRAHAAPDPPPPRGLRPQDDLSRIRLLAEENRKKQNELALLYRISNHMLSTIRLDRLISLVLTALTVGDTPFFDRAMLFLTNEKAGNMQGMLGVTRDDGGAASGRTAGTLEGEFAWDPDEAEIQRQINSPFGVAVRGTRIPLDRKANVSSRAVFEKRVIHVADAAKRKPVDADFIARFGITSFAAAPLMAKEKVLGVIVVDNSPSGRGISTDDLRFLRMLAIQAGVAIENSMLYSRLKDAHRDLCETQERLMQGEKLAAIGEMAATIAHELKSPLVSIGGFANRLTKKLPAASQEWLAADTILKETVRLEKMLADILSYARKPSICYSRCDLRETMDETLRLVLPSMEEAGIRVDCVCRVDDAVFMGDCQQLKQMFLNLLLNAQEAMKSGGVLDVSLLPAELDGAPAAVFTVADTGSGVPLELLNSIFNPFFTTKPHGTGLGLPIVHRIVENHGGKLEVRNRPEGGAEFRVLLPVDR